MGLDGYPVQLIQSNPYPEDLVSKSTISSQYPLMTGYPLGLDIQSCPVISIGYYRIRHRGSKILIIFFMFPFIEA